MTTCSKIALLCSKGNRREFGFFWYLHTLRDSRCVTKIFRQVVALLDPKTKAANIERRHIQCIL